MSHPRRSPTSISGVPVLTPTEKRALHRAYTCALLGYSLLNPPAHIPPLPRSFWSWSTMLDPLFGTRVKPELPE